MSQSAFTSPQRQSSKGITLLAVLSFYKALRVFWPVYLYIVFSINKYSLLIAIAFTFMLMASMVIIAYLKYINFSYFIDTKTHEFVIHKGIINKTKISIEKNKIQEVSINQPFLHKLFGIYELEVDSPGSDKKEVKVHAIAYKNALELKQYLLKDHQLHQEKTEDAINELEQQLQPNHSIRIRPASLIKYGLTANYLKGFLAIMAFAVYILQFVMDIVSRQAENAQKSEGELLEEHINPELLASLSVLTFLVLVIVIFILSILVNLVMNLLIFYGMKITKKKNQLSLEYGLINSKNAIINSDKVQVITTVQNYIQKKMDVLQLKISQIGRLQQKKGNHAYIPGCNDSEKNELMQYLWKKIPEFKWQLVPNIRRLMMWQFWLVLLPVAVAIYFKAILGDYFYLIFLYVTIIELIIVVAHFNQKLSYNEQFIQLTNGVWDIQKKTIEIENLQSIRIAQYFWQKKRNIGSVYIYTAGGRLTLRTTQYDAIKQLVNYCLYYTETHPKSWM